MHLFFLLLFVTFFQLNATKTLYLYHSGSCSVCTFEIKNKSPFLSSPIGYCQIFFRFHFLHSQCFEINKTTKIKR